MLFIITLPILTGYAVRLYVFSFMSFRRRPAAHVTSLAHGDPLVSVLLPVYNEEKVIDRLIESCTSFLHEDYEVIVIDDSTDSTTERLEKWRGNPRVKVIHRSSRSGWKGGALNEGVKAVDPRSEYCYFLDADSVPAPDILDRFLNRMESTAADILQGPQRTDLNAGQSWVALGTSLMLNGFNFVELQAKSDLDLVVPVTGSNFMARTEVLRRFPFEEDIAEDWNLTLRLWCEGKRVSYDRELAVSSESPAGLGGALSQFERWAEGTTRNTLRNARKVAGSRSLRLHQKVDAIVSGMSYSTAVLFFGIFVGGVLMPVPAFAAPPTPFLFWGTVVGLLGLPAAPLSLLAASSTCSTSHKAKAVLSALLETYVVIPFTAYAVIRGFFSGHGAFNRTDKTGWTN